MPKYRGDFSTSEFAGVYRILQKNGESLLWYEYSLPENYEKLWDASVVTNSKQHRNIMLQEFQTMEAISTVSPDIVIESVYYFDSSRVHEGSAIYYKTNLGDYVFYRGLVDGVEMLCTAERFFEYKRAEYEEAIAMNAGGAVLGGGTSVEDWDLSAYDYRSPNFDPAAPLPNSDSEQLRLWLGLGIVVLPLAAVLTVCIIRRKQRVQE